MAALLMTTVADAQPTPRTGEGPEPQGPRVDETRTAEAPGTAESRIGEAVHPEDRAKSGAQNDSSPRYDSAPPVGERRPEARGAEALGGPAFVKVLPALYSGDEIEATVGQELRLAFVVEHPRGLPMQVKALGLPHRATFDAELRSIVWRPTEAELGVYQVRIVASDGAKEASHTVLISVVANRPPVVGSLWFEAVVAQPSGFLVQAHDPEQSDVRLQIEGLPKGAQFEPHTGRIRWTPTENQVGTYPFLVRASDGQTVTVARGQLSVRDKLSAISELSEWTSYLLPGLGYSIYAPRNSDVADVYHGVALELLLAAWIHRNDNRGPSHGRLYVNVELLDAIEADVPLMFTYAGGISLSFERNPARSWAVPHYGVEVGGMIHRQLGAHFQTTPYVGMHLYASPHLFVGARAGYRLVPRRIDELAGIHAGLQLNFSIW